MLSVVLVLEVPKSFMTIMMMMMMSLRDVNGKLATLFNNGTRTKSTNNNGRKKDSVVVVRFCRNRVLVVFLRRQKRERVRFENARANNNVTTQTVFERGPKEQKLSLYYLGYQFLKKKKLKEEAEREQEALRQERAIAGQIADQERDVQLMFGERAAGEPPLGGYGVATLQSAMFED